MPRAVPYWHKPDRPDSAMPPSTVALSIALSKAGAGVGKALDQDWTREIHSGEDSVSSGSELPKVWRGMRFGI